MIHLLKLIYTFGWSQYGDTDTDSDSTESNDRMMRNEMERMWKEAALA
jgi:hypothetical protein